MTSPDGQEPRPPWAPGPASGEGAGTPVGASAPRLPVAVGTALGLGAAAVLASAAWWVLAAVTLGRDAAALERCDTSLPDAAATDLLVPVHALGALLLALGVGMLAVARPAGRGRTVRLVLLGAVLLASLIMSVAGGGPLLLGAAGLGVVLLPLGLATAANLLLIGRRRTDVAHPRWARRALAAEALLWPPLIGGPALAVVVAHLAYADLFRF